MYGWEFPPIQSGGLGVACQGIVEGLLEHQHEVFLILPKTLPGMSGGEKLTILSASDSGGKVQVEGITTTLYNPYSTSEAHYQTTIKPLSSQDQPATIYGKNMMEEVHRYAEKAAVHASNIPHDLIHTHDWLTAEAGVQAKNLSQKPLVMHVHATEFDRSGENPNQQVYDLEKRGMEKADRVVAVSQYTKRMLQKHYGVPEWKIDVVHNAVHPEVQMYQKTHFLEKKDQMVLFLGRMTMQKGPDYFLQMAKKVLSHLPHVKFIMAGDGDMMEQVIKMTIQLEIEKNVLFSGFLKGREIARAYSQADLYVMPSVSEPFGITPLEAIRQGTPVLISKQSGVSEVIKNALRVDFWDVDDMAEKVIAALQYPALSNTLRQRSRKEVEKMSWGKQAGEIAISYAKAVSGKR